jgi:hypothetical protein
MPSEKGTYYTEFLREALLRGDIGSRYTAYAVGRQNGWLSANDIRRRENMNPLPGEQGDIYLVPMNMVPADQAGETNQVGGDESVQDDEEGKRAIVEAHRPLLLDLCGRIVRRVVGEMRTARRKGDGWATVAGVLGAEAESHMVHVLTPAAVAYHVAMGGQAARATAYIHDLATRSVESMRRAACDNASVDTLEDREPGTMAEAILTALGATHAED